MSDQHVDDLLDLYALGALEPAEAAGVERHLEGCPACRAAFEQSRRVVEHLAWSPDQQEPPLELWTKVRRRIESLQRAGRGEAPAGRSRHGWLLGGRVRPLQGLALAGLLLILVLAGWNLTLQRRLDALAAEVREQQQVAAMLSAPGARVVPMVSQPAAPMARGSLVIDPQATGAYLVAQGLPSLPADKAYQLWLTAGEARTSAAVFRVDEYGSATLMVRSEKPMQTYTGCGITIEPAAGSPRPTGDRVLRAQYWDGYQGEN
jgi:anti-sigma-K factor RskA